MSNNWKTSSKNKKPFHLKGRITAFTGPDIENAYRKVLLKQKEMAAQPWHKRDNVWDDLTNTSDKVKNEMEQHLRDIAVKAGVPSGYALDKTIDTLKWVIGEIDLSFENENWPELASKSYYELQRLGYEHPGPIPTMNHILQRTMESAKYYIDKDYGFEEPESAKGLSQGERMGKMIWDELFTAPKKAFLQQYPEKERRAWRNAARKAVERTMSEYRKLLNKRLRGHFNDKSIYF